MKPTTHAADAAAPERRMAPVAEMRAVADRTLVGYAAVYSAETRIAGMFREVIEPGAFRAALQRRDDVRALFNHDPNFVLGRTGAGTLTLTEDSRGLKYAVSLPDTQVGRDLWTSVQRGDVSQSSFAFAVDAEEWRDKSADLPLRVIKSVRLFDVSPVTYPAYDATTVSARATQHVARLRGGDWRDQLATLEAEAATVEAAAPVYVRTMPPVFKRHAPSARAWMRQYDLITAPASRLSATPRPDR